MDIHTAARRSILVLCLLLSLLVPALSRAQIATSDEVTITGRVESRPIDTNLGLWQVAGTRFGVTEGTFFDGFASPPRIGDCVEVRLITDGDRRLATKMRPSTACPADQEPIDREFRGVIASRPEGGANGPWNIRGADGVVRTFLVSDATIFESFGDRRPFAGACVLVNFVLRGGQAYAERFRPADCSLPADTYYFRGPVDARPAEGRLGQWVIGGRTFSAVEATVFEGFASGPAAGDCVELKFRIDAGRLIILGMRPAECAGEQPTLLEAAGLIDSAPEGGRFGLWTIGGVAYTARDGETTFDTRYGVLEAGRCAVVLFRIDGDLRIAVRIASREPERCTPSEELHTFYGVVERLPDNTSQLGIWVIGGRPVGVVAETKLVKPEGSAFAVGSAVEVTVKRGPDGRLLAVEIELKRRTDEPPPPVDGKAFGTIDSLPAEGVLGVWSIGGVSYRVSEQTGLRPGETPFAAGDCVEVYFRKDGDARIALGIARGGGDDCTLPGGGEEIGRAIGKVEAMPEAGLVGAWTIGGVTYQVIDQTEFIFQAGAGSPVVGSFVELRYVQVAGVKTAKAIRTITPPGMGGENQTGRLEAPLTRATTGNWTVNGVSFAITDDTMVYDAQQALAAGALVTANLAVDPATGARTATQVTVLTTVYLPMLSR